MSKNSENWYMGSSYIETIGFWRPAHKKGLFILRNTLFCTKICYSLYCSHFDLVWTLTSPACHFKAPTAWKAWARFVNPTLNTLTSLARRKTQQWTNMSRRSPVVSLLFRLFSVTLTESTKPATCNLQSAILQFCICRSFEKQVLGNCIHFPFFQRVWSQYPLHAFSATGHILFIH